MLRLLPFDDPIDFHINLEMIRWTRSVHKTNMNVNVNVLRTAVGILGATLCTLCTVLF